MDAGIPGENCTAPQALTLSALADGGVGTNFVVDLTTYTDEHTGSCNSTGGPEAVYSITTTQAQDIIVLAQRPAGNMGSDPVVYVRQAPCATSADLACSDSAGAATPELVTLRNAAAGTYFIFIEHYGPPGAGAGPIDVSVDLAPPTMSPPGESCAAALPVTLGSGLPDGGMGSSAAFTVDTSMFASDHAGSCSSSSGSAEAVYQLTLTAASDVRITSQPSSGSTADPVLYLRSSPCATGTELACADVFSGAEVISRTNLPAGDYFIFVEAYSSSAGPTDVTVEVTPPTLGPPNDTCASPQALSFTSGVATVSSTTIGATNNNQSSDPTPTCSSTARSDGQDVIYSYTLTSAQDVTITLTPMTPFNAALYVRANNCTSTATTDQLSCDTSTGTVINRTLLNQQPGTYYIWVDTYLSNPGPFTLQVTLAPPTLPPANDTCAGVQALSFSGNVATASGTLVGATNNNASGDPTPSCSSSARSTGVDVVYSYTLTSAQDVAINVTPGTPSFTPVVYVRSAVCDSTATLADQRGCVLGSSGTPVNTALLNQQPGTYYLWVDSTTATAGTFNLSLTLSPPTLTPANDLCLTPITLFADGGVYDTLTATTLGANDNYSASCQTSGTVDVVYALTTTSTQKLTVNATGTSLDGGLLRPSLFLRDQAACQADGGFLAPDGGPLSAPGCANSHGGLETDQLIVSSLAPGSYLLVVDGFRSAVGRFNLEARLDPVDPVASNENCGAATPLTFVGGTAIVEGTTRDAGQDHTGITCSASSSGAGSSDVVYRFTTPAANPASDGGINARVMAISRNAFEYGPAVYLRNNCETDAGTQLACSQLSGSATHHASAYVLGLAPSTDYWVWVDTSGASNKGGPFTLQVDVAPTSPANDTCAGAISIPFNTSIAGTNLGAAADYSSSNIITGAAGCTETLAGADVVYTFTTMTAGPVTVTALPQRGFNLDLAVLANACSAGNCVDAVDPTSSGDPAVITFNAMANTTYYVIVDAFSTSVGGNTSNPTGRGGFVLSVSN